MDDVTNADLRLAAEEYLEARDREKASCQRLVKMMKQRDETGIAVRGILIERPDTDEAELFVSYHLCLD